MNSIDNSGCGSSCLLCNSLANCRNTVKDFCFKNQEKCVLICIKKFTENFHHLPENGGIQLESASIFCDNLLCYTNSG